MLEALRWNTDTVIKNNLVRVWFGQCTVVALFKDISVSGTINIWMFLNSLRLHVSKELMRRPSCKLTVVPSTPNGRISMRTSVQCKRDRAKKRIMEQILLTSFRADDSSSSDTKHVSVQMCRVNYVPSKGFQLSFYHFMSAQKLGLRSDHSGALKYSIVRAPEQRYQR